MIFIRRFATAILLIGAMSCATTDDGGGGSSSNRGKGFRGVGGNMGKKDNRPQYVSAQRATLINSLTNNSLTSRTISLGKAEQQASRLSPNAKDKKTLEGRISALRLAKKPVNSLLDAAKKLADLEMKRGGVNNQIDDDVKLELAIGAVNSKKFALAEYYLQNLFSSKSAKVRAGAYNLTGVIALRNGRIPTAVVNFKESLKNISSYRPAQLNLGFIALRGGDVSTSKRAFSSMQSDWFVQTGLVTISRLEGNQNRVQSLCSKLLSRNHKPTLYNCGLHEFQVKKNYKQAKVLMNKAVKARGNKEWDTAIYKMITKVNFEEAQAKKKKAAQKSGGKK